MAGGISLRSYKVLIPGWLLCTHLQTVGANTIRKLFAFTILANNNFLFAVFQLKNATNLPCVMSMTPKPSTVSQSLSGVRRQRGVLIKLLNLANHPVSPGRQGARKTGQDCKSGVLGAFDSTIKFV